MHWIDRDPVAEEWFENTLNSIFSYIEEEKRKSPNNIIPLPEDAVIEEANCDVWELLFGKEK